VFKSRRGQDFRPVLIGKWVAMPLVAAMLLSVAHWCMAQGAQNPANGAQANPAQGKANPYHKPEDDGRPSEIPAFKLDQTLKTVPVSRDRPLFNVNMVDASLLPRDKKGIWVLDISFKPVRIRTVEIPGKGRRLIHYLLYKVVNRTGETRMFAPQFVMVNEKQQRFEDQVIPEAIPVIRKREDPGIPLLGAVDVVGMLPPSTKPNVEDAVFGAACWDRWDRESDRFSIYVRGLSDGYVEVPPDSGGKPVTKYKTLRIDFIRRGDARNINENEILLADPKYEWVYW
jgi:hypothetical protein